MYAFFLFEKEARVCDASRALCTYIIVVFHEFTIDYKSYDMAIYLAC